MISMKIEYDLFSWRIYSPQQNNILLVKQNYILKFVDVCSSGIEERLN